MAVAEITVFATAATTTALAAVLPWVRREPGLPLPWERMALVVILVLDALYEWTALAFLQAPRLGATWALTFYALGISNLGIGIGLALRGHALLGIHRWIAVAALTLLEPLLLFICFMAVVVRGSPV